MFRQLHGFVRWLTIHYLSQYLPRSALPHGVTSHNDLSHIFSGTSTANVISKWLWEHVTQLHISSHISHDDVITMKTFSALLALCVGNSPVNGEFPSQRPVTRSFDVSLIYALNKWLSKQLGGWWFETPSRPLWRHCNVYRCCHGVSSLHLEALHSEPVAALSWNVYHWIYAPFLYQKHGFAIH